MLTNIFIVGVGGFIGSIARYFAYLWARNYFPGNFPIATLIVNVVGCFAIGVLAEAIRKTFPLQEEFALLISVGFLGALTTFSTFGLETTDFLRENFFSMALLNVLANLCLGILAVFAGRYLYSLFI